MCQSASHFRSAPARVLLVGFIRMLCAQASVRGHRNALIHFLDSDNSRAEKHNFRLYVFHVFHLLSLMDYPQLRMPCSDYVLSSYSWRSVGSDGLHCRSPEGITWRWLYSEIRGYEGTRRVQPTQPEFKHQSPH